MGARRIVVSSQTPAAIKLDFSFKSLLSSKDLNDEVERGEISGMKRSQRDGKLLCTVLRLNNNNISDVKDLPQTLENLFHHPDGIQWLDLSFNDIHSTDGLFSKLKSLKVVYLHGNAIERLQEIEKLCSLSDLKSLTLHGNPIESEKGYRQYVISLLPGLKTLDFSTVTKHERSMAETWIKMHGGKKLRKKGQQYKSQVVCEQTLQ